MCKCVNSNVATTIRNGFQSKSKANYDQSVVDYLMRSFAILAEGVNICTSYLQYTGAPLVKEGEKLMMI